MRPSDVAQPVFHPPETEEDRQVSVPRQHRPGSRWPRREDKIPRTPENLRHAREAKEMDQVLTEALGKPPERCAPTADGRGHIRLTFADARRLLGYDDD